MTTLRTHKPASYARSAVENTVRIAEQLRLNIETAELLGYTAPDEYRFDDMGLDNRLKPDLQRLLARAREGGAFELLVLRDRSRFGRSSDPRKYWSIVLELGGLGVEVVNAEELGRGGDR